MSEDLRIGILTGGGDVPGLNSVIKSVVYRTSQLGGSVLGIRKGWEGLTHARPGAELDSEYLVPLTRKNTRTIDRTGGTVLHTSRTNPQRVRSDRLPDFLDPKKAEGFRIDESSFDLTPVVLDNVESLDLDCLIVIGGDDTLGYGARLESEGVDLVAIPKTMDNDVPGTEYCIGFSTAVTRAKDLVNRQRTTLGSHERIGIFRIFGRDSGFTALYTGYVTSARCLIPEHPFDLDHLCSLMAEDKASNPSSYAVVIASEGAVWHGQELAEFGEADAYGHRKKVDVGYALAQEIRHRTGLETQHADLTYDLRSGEPDALDQMVATTFANVAIDLVSDGVWGRMVAIRGGRYTHSPLPDPDLGPRTVDVETHYDTDRYRPRYGSKLGAPLLLSST